AARRVIGRHVERFEVVPVRLRLGSLGDRVSHRDEDVLELVARLGGGMQVTALGAIDHLGEIDTLGGGTSAALLVLERPTALVESVAYACAGGVDGLTSVFALLGRQTPECRVERRQRRSLAHHVLLRCPQLLHGRGSDDPLPRLAFEPRKGVEHLSHGPCSSSNAPTGRLKRNVEPSPSTDSATRWPPWAS